MEQMNPVRNGDICDHNGRRVQVTHLYGDDAFVEDLATRTGYFVLAYKLTRLAGILPEKLSDEESNNLWDIVHNIQQLTYGKHHEQDLPDAAPSPT